MTLFDTGVRPAIDEYLKKKGEEKRDYGKYWSASSAGYCKRKVIFDRLGVPPVTEDARKTRVFEVGHIFHGWIQDITKNAGLSIASEVELQDEDLMVRGHFDDLIEFTFGDEKEQTHKILYDYKTAHSRSFTYQKDRPMSHYHRLQLGTYLYMLRNKYPELEEARILTISKDDLRMAEKQLMWSTELEEDVKDYWGTLNHLWETSVIPPCTCADNEGGFMAKELYNPYFYKGEPCSLAWKEKHDSVQAPADATV